MANHRFPSHRLVVATVLGAAVAGAVVVGCNDVGDFGTDGTSVTEDDAAVAADVAPNDVEGRSDAGAVDAGFDAARSREQVSCEASPCVTAIAAQGGAHVCALLSDQTVRCWGDDRFGQLGHSLSDGGVDQTYDANPSAVAGLSGVTQLAVRGNDSFGTSCARLEDGGVMCWGSNDHGQLGLASGAVVRDGDSHPTPSLVQGIPPVARIDLAGAFSCAQQASEGGGGLYCWGLNSVLQLGRGHLGASYQVPGQVALGPVHTVQSAGTIRNAFALSDRADLFSWGGNSWNVFDATQRDALGRESSLSPDGTPTMITSLPAVTAFAASDWHACALSRGRAFCWGVNATGAVDRGSLQDTRAPLETLIDGEGLLDGIFVSNRGTCASTQFGNLFCWGDDGTGQLGENDGGVSSKPPQIVLPDRVFGVAMMDQATCALIRDGSVHCWGGNRHGELGQGTADDQAHRAPARVVLK